MIHPIYIVNIYLVTFTFNRHFGFVHNVIHSTWERENNINKTTTVENLKLILAEAPCCWCECDRVFHLQFANKVFIRLFHFSEWNLFCFLPIPTFLLFIGLILIIPYYEHIWTNRWMCFDVLIKINDYFLYACNAVTFR